ncbi:MAG TPA: recombinase RecT [Solirubrobacterales bacterium]|nr:recombinase RecT [Solirubrobacterales bacterium]
MNTTAEPVSRNGDGQRQDAARYRAAVRATMRKREAGADGVFRRVEPTEEEVDRFLMEAALYGLEPLTGQVYASWDDGVMRAVTTIDGLRARSVSTGADDGQDDPEWCDREGNWTDFWAGEDHPTAARVRVYRKGARRPFTGTANWSDFAPVSVEGSGAMWGSVDGMPAHMLSIRSEAIARRKAFPAELSGLYTVEELGIELPPPAPAGTAAADVPGGPAAAPGPEPPPEMVAYPPPQAPAPVPAPPPPGEGPAGVIVDPPAGQPSGAPAAPRARQTLAEVLGSADYGRVRGDLTEALFGMMPDRLTDAQARQLAGALREADAAGVTAAELERLCRISRHDAPDRVDLRAQAIFGWIRERARRAAARACTPDAAAGGGAGQADPPASSAVGPEAEDGGADPGGTGR